MPLPPRPPSASHPCRLLIAALCGLYLLLAPATAQATTCRPYDDRYFLSCDKGVCQAAFRVAEVEGFGTCSRRPAVEDVDPKVGAYLVSLLLASAGSGADGVYELRFPISIWWRRDSGRWEDFKTGLDGSLRYEEGPHCVGDLKPAEMSALLDKKHPGWLTHRADMAPGGLPALRRSLERDALMQHLLVVLAWVAYWSSSLLALLALVHSVQLYFSRLYADVEPPKLRRLAGPLGMQLGLALLGAAALFAIPIYMFWAGSLLVPTIVVILLAEGWARFRSGRRQAAHPTGS